MSTVIWLTPDRLIRKFSYRPTQELCDYETREWLKIFGGDEDLIAVIALGGKIEFRFVDEIREPWLSISEVDYGYGFAAVFEDDRAAVEWMLKYGDQLR